MLQANLKQGTTWNARSGEQIADTFEGSKMMLDFAVNLQEEIVKARQISSNYFIYLFLSNRGNTSQRDYFHNKKNENPNAELKAIFDKNCIKI